MTGANLPINVQVIERDGKPEWAIKPYEEVERLVEEVEMRQDVRAYHKARKALAEGEELIPKEGSRFWEHGVQIPLTTIPPATGPTDSKAPMA